MKSSTLVLMADANGTLRLAGNVFFGILKRSETRAEANRIEYNHKFMQPQDRFRNQSVITIGDFSIHELFGPVRSLFLALSTPILQLKAHVAHFLRSTGLTRCWTLPILYGNYEKRPCRASPGRETIHRRKDKRTASTKRGLQERGKVETERERCNEGYHWGFDDSAERREPRQHLQ